MSDYRINVRFHDDNEEERRAAEYLKTLHRSRNQFVVDAVLARMDDTKLLDNIRQIFREEVVPLSISPVQPVHQTVSTELTEEQKEENRKNVLADLDVFGRAKNTGFWLKSPYFKETLSHFGSTWIKLSFWQLVFSYSGKGSK